MSHLQTTRSRFPALSGPAVLSVLVALAAPAPGAAATVPLLPDFAAAVFLPATAIDNRYFPLAAGPKRVFAARGVSVDGAPVVERFELTPGGPGPVIAGVQTTTMIDRAYEGALLVEETFDFYAQDTGGNVWYMGEDVINYRYDANGTLIGTDSESAWRTGVNQARPGFAMPADPVPGLAYFQEFAAADAALDEGLILGFLDRLDLPGQRFTNVLMVFETSTLDPALREIKYYAPGIGLVRADEGLDGDRANPSLTFTLVAPVPLPGALSLLAATVAALAALGRRRARRAYRPDAAVRFAP